jgi:hypothetical protein
MEAADVLVIPATEAICERIFRWASDVLAMYVMSLHGSSFERHILMANFIVTSMQLAGQGSRDYG